MLNQFWTVNSKRSQVKNSQYSGHISRFTVCSKKEVLRRLNGGENI